MGSLPGYDRQGIVFSTSPSVCARVLYGPIPTISLILPPHLELESGFGREWLHGLEPYLKLIEMFSGCLLRYLPCLR